MKITDEIKKKFISVKFAKEILPELDLTKEKKIELKNKIKCQDITKMKKE